MTQPKTPPPMKEEHTEPLLTKTTLFTTKGCPHCATAKWQYREQIKAGEMIVRHCVFDGSPEEQQNWELAMKQQNMDGFPSIYAPDGAKLF